MILEWNESYFIKGEQIKHSELFEKINDNEINLIETYESGNRLLGEKYRIEVKDKNNKSYFVYMGGTWFSVLINKINQKQIINKNLLNKMILVEKKEFNFLRFFINSISTISSVIFMFYILSNIKKSSTKMKKQISSSQKSLFTFQDVAGNEEEKEEMKELIDFLKKPQKYKEIGASVPKGVLLQGPPGTGKTLLAKAVAGEAGVPFYAVTGSDFKNQYFGVGAAKLRELFKEARENSPCVVFIDEIDTIGRKRGTIANDDGSTINSLLTEMDGFTKSIGVIVMAATNRVDTLDSALLRPGRFDRQFTVSLPDVKAREAILTVHARNKNIDPFVDLSQIAKLTPGFSGAELASVLNEAAILSVRNNQTIITQEELYESIDRVMMGPAKKSRKYNEEEKKMVAYHEAGHAVIGLKLKHAPKVQKVTIIPRGDAGGYNLMLPEKETFFSSKKRMLANITSYLGGRAAEELMFDDISNGAYGDFKSATQIATQMVTKLGMSDLGPIQTKDNMFFENEKVNQEVKKIIDECMIEAKKIMKENKTLLDKIAHLLIKQETITKEEIEKLL
ncbi:ATP-dependent zinc metalloprotease FtsH [Candidatus Phytoplasma pruni]|uniref:ATP-dependent zinc metalloprotease FtsH n=2 Tax=Candidatus Phytoplasma pruni TaxID=479893 RepID=A0A851HG78_9MOLU|nr:ATP-dependent zinc metalloprotease FtsH [Candidatus Phytoplasma pruni]